MPLLYLVFVWGGANALAQSMGGGWRRHLIATAVSGAAATMGIVATFFVGLWLERRERRDAASEVTRAMVVFWAGLSLTTFLAWLATYVAL